MQAILECLNQYGIAITLLVNVTFVILTYLALQETRRARISQSNPVVVAGIELRRWMLALFVRNIGQGTATFVSVSFEPPLPPVGKDGPLSTLHLPVLPPHKEWACLVGLTVDGRVDSPQTYKVVATYQTPERRRETASFSLDTARYIESGETYDILYRALDRMDKVVDRLDKIARNVEQLKDQVRRR